LSASVQRIAQTKMEMTMRKKILIMLVVPLIAALTAQAAAASEHRHTPAKDHAAAWEHCGTAMLMPHPV